MAVMVDLQRIEAALERAMDGAFGRALPGKLHPLEVYQALWRAVEAGRVISAGASYAPNRLEAHLHPQDLEALAGLKAQLQAELQTQLQEHVAYNGWRYGARMVVRLEADEAARPGAVRVTATVDGDPLPAWLIAEGGPAVGLSFELHPGATLGRSAECEIMVADDAVSRHHCRFDWVFEGYRIADLGSSNGTFVNGVQVSEYVLGNNDVISVGNSKIRFQYEE